MPKAYVFTRYGGPEVEAFAEVDRPVPGRARSWSRCVPRE
ncbi:hypothetical protein SALBM311S_08798 [Streptomyces alboniger]